MANHRSRDDEESFWNPHTLIDWVTLTGNAAARWGDGDEPAWSPKC